MESRKTLEKSDRIRIGKVINPGAFSNLKHVDQILERKSVASQLLVDSRNPENFPIKYSDQPFRRSSVKTNEQKFKSTADTFARLTKYQAYQRPQISSIPHGDDFRGYNVKTSSIRSKSGDKSNTTEDLELSLAEKNKSLSAISKEVEHVIF